MIFFAFLLFAFLAWGPLMFSATERPLFAFIIGYWWSKICSFFVFLGKNYAMGPGKYRAATTLACTDVGALWWLAPRSPNLWLCWRPWILSKVFLAFKVQPFSSANNTVSVCSFDFFVLVFICTPGPGWMITPRFYVPILPARWVLEFLFCLFSIPLRTAMFFIRIYSFPCHNELFSSLLCSGGSQAKQDGIWGNGFGLLAALQMSYICI